MKLGLVGLLAGCMSPVMHFGAGKSADEAQHDQANKLTPPLLSPTGERHGAASTEKIRVWADDDFRAQNVHWEHAFAEELEYANAILEPMLGLRLDAEFHAWDRHAQDASLEQDLVALAALDPGDGVFTVVGLTSSLSLVTEKIEQIGFASTPGKYLVLRGYADLVERKAFERAFPELDREERASLHEARHRHKTAAVLLHELGHNLGAQHEDTPDTMMSPTYSHRTSGFSENARDTMLATVDRRLGRAHDVPASAVATRQLVIAITALGTTYDGVPIDAAGLDSLFKSAPHETEVVLHFRRGAPHGTMTELVERARAAGLARVSVEAD